MVDRLDYKVMGFAILILLCWMGYSPLACRGAVDWSDDFNDGNYNDWTICENQALMQQLPDYGFGGSDWSATNSYLQIDQNDLGIIAHPSDVAYGTWSFDYKVNEALVERGVVAQFVFIDNSSILTNDDFSDVYAYWIEFTASSLAEGYRFAISLEKAYGGVYTTIDSSETTVPLAGWHHIDVTRTAAGLFSVYHNGSLIVQGEDIDVKTSEMFWLWFEHESMTDNIVVDDAPPIDWLPIAIVGASAVVIVLVVVIILKRR